MKSSRPNVCGGPPWVSSSNAKRYFENNSKCSVHGADLCISSGWSASDTSRNLPEARTIFTRVTRSPT